MPGVAFAGVHALARLCAYIILICLPWLVLISIARVAFGDAMQSGQFVPRPPAVQYWEKGERQPFHPYPDCTDFTRYALTKIPNGRAALAYTKEGVPHMVATFDRDGNTYVLDNLSREYAVYWRDLPYRWISRQHGRAWFAITNGEPGSYPPRSDRP